MTATLSRLSVDDLNAEIRRRQRATEKLARKYNRILGKAKEIEAQIERLGGSVNGGARRGPGSRVRNEMTLVEALAAALDGKTLSVPEAAATVQKQGYRTNSNNFRTQVNIALIKSGKFKRVERGQYTAK